MEVEDQTALDNRIFVYIDPGGFKGNVYYGYHVILQLIYLIFVEYMPEILFYF